MSQKGRNWPSWQAKDRKESGFLCITKSQERSPAYRELSGNQIRLLHLCQRRGDYRANDPSRKHLPRDDYPGVDKYRPDEAFLYGAGCRCQLRIIQANESKVLRGYESTRKKLGLLNG